MAGRQFFAYEDLSVSTTSVGFTAATRDGADYARVTVEGGPVRYRLDGGTPTATSGATLEVGEAIELENEDEVLRIRFIIRDGVAATLRCHYARSR